MKTILIVHYVHFAHIMEAHGYGLIVAVPAKTYGGSVRECSLRFKQNIMKKKFEKIVELFDKGFKHSYNIVSGRWVW